MPVLSQGWISRRKSSRQEVAAPGHSAGKTNSQGRGEGGFAWLCPTTDAPKDTAARTVHSPCCRAPVKRLSQTPSGHRVHTKTSYALILSRRTTTLLNSLTHRSRQMSPEVQLLCTVSLRSALDRLTYTEKLAFEQAAARTVPKHLIVLGRNS